ncbi:hypothetical protein [Euzebya rosea]|uniref:hypothetical protein n=1 Tax=Euzebya rosea TaxID=2052804 RepID=UPI000D3E6EE0|nr:hypothetical protein [Euzebya rosea]
MHDAQGNAVTIDLTDDTTARRFGATTLPVGRRAQLLALRQQLEWCEQAVMAAQRDADRAMRSSDLSDDERWRAVQKLRALSWKVCREVLPLISRVPPGLRDHEAYRGVEEAGHSLRRRTEDAMRDNANYAVDLVNAANDRVTARW